MGKRKCKPDFLVRNTTGLESPVYIMKLLFGQTYFLRFDPKLYAAMQPYPPLGTLYAASYMRERGTSPIRRSNAPSETAGPHEKTTISAPSSTPATRSRAGLLTPTTTGAFRSVTVTPAPLRTGRRSSAPFVSM